MSNRQQPIELQVLALTAAPVLSDWEMPANKAYTAFSERLDADLLALEHRFRAFCTASSFAGSLDR